VTELELTLMVAALRDDIRNRRLPSDTTKTLRRLLPLLETSRAREALLAAQIKYEVTK
jgi:hypothetical protein